MTRERHEANIQLTMKNNIWWGTGRDEINYFFLVSSLRESENNTAEKKGRWIGICSCIDVLFVSPRSCSSTAQGTLNNFIFITASDPTYSAQSALLSFSLFSFSHIRHSFTKATPSFDLCVFFSIHCLSNWEDFVCGWSRKQPTQEDVKFNFTFAAALQKSVTQQLEIHPCLCYDLYCHFHRLCSLPSTRSPCNALNVEQNKVTGLWVNTNSPLIFI